MAKKKLFDIALECEQSDDYVLGSELQPGFEDTLEALVIEGPLDSGSIPSKESLEDLITHGYAARVLVNQEEPEKNNYATFKGRDLYIHLKGLDPSVTTLREVIGKENTISKPVEPEAS